MNQSQSEADKLFEEALDLIIRLQNDPENPISRDLVRRWRSRRPQHEAAWADAAEIHGMAGVILEERQKRESTKPATSRRKVILGGLAGIAMIGAGAFYGPDLLIRLRADYLTPTAEIRQISLSDGTLVTLGPESAIRIEFSERTRRVELLEGMAFFDVASDPGRPFQATVDDVAATALGTAFDLSKNAGFITVVVDHGIVGIDLAVSGSATGEPLAEGDWMTLEEGSRFVERGRREKSQIASWRDGLIIADRETISSVVARIARWHNGHIFLADPSFGSHRISGVFDLNDPATALEAVVLPHGGKVRQLSPWLLVVSPI